MLRCLKIGIASLVISSFAIAPAVIMISADTAIAKNDKGKGSNSSSKGNNGSKGNSSKKSKSSSSRVEKSQGGKSTRTSNNQSITSFGKKLKSGFGLFGGNKKKEKQPRKTVLVRAKPSPKIIKAFDHPSNLGKMNGAINSSPQSKLAHIKNGNFNGPVGIAAAYALANYDYVKAFADYEDAQAIVQELEPLSEAFDYAASYDAAVEELVRLDSENVDPTSDEYMKVAAAADADAYQSALDTISEAEAESIENGKTLTEETVNSLLAEAKALEEPGATELEEAEANLFALYKGGEESLTDSEKEMLLQNINLPSAVEIEEITAIDEYDENNAELEEDGIFEAEDVRDES